MAETTNIAKMADKVSREIFEVFGWTRKRHHDLNFPCEVKEHKKKTHPSDVVFRYDSPHDQNIIYINTDLKSYAAKTITSGEITKAANNMILAMDCANRSAEWRKRYVSNDENYDVHGLLFIYNHDNEFHKEWPKLLADSKINTRKINGTIDRRLYILGPTDICYLISVSDDITRMRGQNILPQSADCYFHYPDLAVSRVKRNMNSAATMEILSAPWMLLKYNGQTGDKKHVEGAHCYYNGKGQDHEEFMSLIDYLFRTQMVGDSNTITIKCPFADTAASAQFERAKEQYCTDHHSLMMFKERLERIKFEPLTHIRTHFSEVALGMED